MTTTVKEKMARYLALHKEREVARAETEHQMGIAARCTRELQSLSNDLLQLVQPRCGSANQPSRRIYTDGQYTTLIVEWDDKHSRPRIDVQEPEQ